MLEPVFNDLSADPPVLDVGASLERMWGLVELLRVAPDHGLGPGLRIPQTFHSLCLGPEYRISDWLNDDRVPREQRLFLLTLATRSPYLEQTPDAIQERALLTDVRFRGMRSDALRAAFLLELPLLSFLNAPWDQAVIQCECEELIDDELTPARDLQLPNLSKVPHFTVHAEWIRNRRRRSVATTEDVWNRRGELFPNLDFCPAVEGQLVAVRPSEPRFQQIINKLFDLDAYFASWTVGGFDPGAFAKCNPASPETLARYPSDYRFLMADGGYVTASWHLYFTPGKGRLYFAADGALRRGVVCHIGDKLPDSTYGRT
jgi:hypothetical protein